MPQDSRRRERRSSRSRSTSSSVRYDDNNKKRGDHNIIKRGGGGHDHNDDRDERTKYISKRDHPHDNDRGHETSSRRKYTSRRSRSPRDSSHQHHYHRNSSNRTASSRHHRSSRSKSRSRRRSRSRSRSYTNNHSNNSNSRRCDRTSSTKDYNTSGRQRTTKHRETTRRSKSPAHATNNDSSSSSREMTPVAPDPPQISDLKKVTCDPLLLTSDGRIKMKQESGNYYHDEEDNNDDDSHSGNGEISNVYEINLPTENYNSTPYTGGNKSKMHNSNYKSKGETYKYYGDDSSLAELDKEKIQQEMQERLRQHLAAEGKVYPPPKPQQASHPFFANDGSFLETFKRMQEQQQQIFCHQPSSYLSYPVVAAPAAAAALNTLVVENKYEHLNKATAANSIAQSQQQQQQQYQTSSALAASLFGKRRGGKILKTGIVEKPRPIQELDGDNVKDAWSMYMQEVKKYKNSACDISSKTRPLLK